MTPTSENLSSLIPVWDDPSSKFYFKIQIFKDGVTEPQAAIETTEALVIANPCHQIYYSNVDQEMNEEQVTFSFFYSSRLTKYIPTNLRLPIITHHSMITGSTCPSLRLVAADDDDEPCED